MTKTNDALSNALGIETNIEIIEPKKEQSVVSFTGNDAENDYELARRTFRNLIEQGNLAMEDMKNLARESKSPRAYEVFSTMMKTISDTTKDLYDLHKKTKELKEINNKTSKSDGDITVEKAVFIGTTADLLKRIKEEKQ
jgi:trehalose/maltose hydrolase-like predicted phosphorylase